MAETPAGASPFGEMQPPLPLRAASMFAAVVGVCLIVVCTLLVPLLAFAYLHDPSQGWSALMGIAIVVLLLLAVLGGVAIKFSGRRVWTARIVTAVAGIPVGASAWGLSVEHAGLRITALGTVFGGLGLVAGAGLAWLIVRPLSPKARPSNWQTALGAGTMQWLLLAAAYCVMWNAIVYAGAVTTRYPSQTGNAAMTGNDRAAPFMSSEVRKLGAYQTLWRRWEKAKEREAKNTLSLWSAFPLAPAFWRAGGHRAHVEAFEGVEATFRAAERDLGDIRESILSPGSAELLLRTNANRAWPEWVDLNALELGQNEYIAGVERYASLWALATSMLALAVVGCGWFFARRLLRRRAASSELTAMAAPTA